MNPEGQTDEWNRGHNPTIDNMQLWLRLLTLLAIITFAIVISNAPWQNREQDSRLDQLEETLSVELNPLDGNIPLKFFNLDYRIGQLEEGSWQCIEGEKTVIDYFVETVVSDSPHTKQDMYLYDYRGISNTTDWICSFQDTGLHQGVKWKEYVMECVKYKQTCTKQIWTKET